MKSSSGEMLVPDSSPGDPIAGTGEIAPTFRAMTFNIRHGKGIGPKANLELTSRFIRNANVDIAALQEVDRYLPRSGFINQITKLARDLKMYWRFSQSVEIGVTQYGNTILSKYPIIEHKKIYICRE